jgi:hypothetical protein
LLAFDESKAVTSAVTSYFDHQFRTGSLSKLPKIFQHFAAVRTVIEYCGPLPRLQRSREQSDGYKPSSAATARAVYKPLNSGKILQLFGREIDHGLTLSHQNLLAILSRATISSALEMVLQRIRAFTLSGVFTAKAAGNA